MEASAPLLPNTHEPVYISVDQAPTNSIPRSELHAGDKEKYARSAWRSKAATQMRNASRGGVFNVRPNFPPQGRADLSRLCIHGAIG